MTISSSQPSGPKADDLVRDVTLATFKTDVVEASLKAPVLVSFWAAWEPSSKQLNDALEKLARAFKGAFRLAKVDIDKGQPIVQQMGVQEIPSVYAIYKSRPVDAFSGALTEPHIRAWIDRLLKAIGVPAEENVDLAPALAEAEALRAAHDGKAALALYEDILLTAPESAAAYAGKVRCVLEEGDAQKAKELLAAAPPSVAKDRILNAVRAAIELAEQAGSAGGVGELEQRLAQKPDDLGLRYELALACYAAGRHEDAADHLLEIIRRDRTWNDEAARKQLLKFFEAFGMTNPLTVAARKRLSSLLFS